MPLACVNLRWNLRSICGQQYHSNTLYHDYHPRELIRDAQVYSPFSEMQKVWYDLKYSEEWKGYVKEIKFLRKLWKSYIKEKINSLKA
jgi:hypothetical protein